MVDAKGLLTLNLRLIFDFFGGGTPIFAELAWFCASSIYLA